MPTADTEGGVVAIAGAEHNGYVNAGNRACLRCANNGAELPRIKDGKPDIVGRVGSDGT